MKKSVVVGVAIAVMAISGSALAEEKRDPAWTLQIGYAPAAVGGVFSGEEESVGGGAFIPIGGAFSADWRSRGRWGVHIPISFTMSPKNTGRIPIVGVGANAVFHFRDHGRKFDPYLLMGGKVFVAVDKSRNMKTVALPLPSVGIGMRGFLSKNVGLYGEVSAQGLPLPGGAAGLLQGSFGVSIRF